MFHFHAIVDREVKDMAGKCLCSRLSSLWVYAKELGIAGSYGGIYFLVYANSQH